MIIVFRKMKIKNIFVFYVL